MKQKLINGFTFKTAPRPSSFRKDINALRALAVIGVVLYHFNPAWMPGGFAGEPATALALWRRRKGGAS